MSIITDVAQELHRVLGSVSRQAGVDSQLIRRRSQHSHLDGATFVQTLVFGWLANPQSSLQELACTATLFGVRITPQGLAQRFTEFAVECLRQVLEAAATTLLTADGVALPLLRRFNGVFVQDSSVVALPLALAQRWPGCGGGAPGGKTAALKLHVRWDLLCGQLCGPLVTEGTTHDRDTALVPEELPPGSLWLADLGFFKLAWLAAMTRRKVYWLSRVQAGTLVARSDQRGVPTMSMPALLQQLQRERDAGVWEVSVFLGERQRVAARLLIVPVPPTVATKRRAQLEYQAGRKYQPVSQERLALCDWTILATNVPAEQLNVGEAMVLYRMRWQIERLFRLWKECGQIDSWRSSAPHRIECELLAKMLGQVVQHWVMLCGCWELADRSLYHVAQAIRKQIVFLGMALRQPRRLRQTLKLMAATLAGCGRIQKRKRAPANFQLLAHPPKFGYP